MFKSVKYVTLRSYGEQGPTTFLLVYVYLMIDYGMILFNHLDDCFHSCDLSSYTVSNDAWMNMASLFPDKRFGLCCIS